MDKFLEAKQQAKLKMQAEWELLKEKQDKLQLLVELELFREEQFQLEAKLQNIKKEIREDKLRRKSILDESLSLTGIDHLYVNTNLMTWTKKGFFPKNEEKLMTYLNQYLIHTTNGNPNVIELDYTNRGKPFVYRSYRQTAIAHLPIKDAFDFWKYSEIKRECQDPMWIPYTIDVPDHYNYRNLFLGFKHKVPTDLTPKIPSVKIIPILNLIKEVWCANNEDYYNYVISWFAYKLQNPQDRIGIPIVLKSIVQADFKNTVMEYFARYVLGDEYCRATYNIKDILRKFYADSERLLIFCFNETPSFKNAGRIKELITQQRKREWIKCKGLEPREVINYIDYIICLECDCKYVQNEKYFTNIRKQFNDESGKEMFEYLLTYDVSKWKKNIIPAFNPF